MRVRTVVVAVIVEHVTGVIVGDDEFGGVELMRSKWREHPSEQRGPLRQALLTYVHEIEMMAALVTVTFTVIVVMVVEHVTGVAVGIDEAGGGKIMISEWREQGKVYLREKSREDTSWRSLIQLRSVMAS